MSRLPLGFDLERHTKFLLLTVTLGAGLVLVGCGDDDTATTPAPAPPPPAPAPDPDPDPEPPAPEAPATPTGLMVSATTETSITWTWDAVEGATAYAVQQSADEMFDATDTASVTLEPTHTASDLEPETSVFVRVAAAVGTLEDHVLSAWTTHVTGMSAMPVPEPVPEPEPEPELDPVMVTFSLSDDADSSYPLIPDPDDEDEATAMAAVNTEMMVMSNTTAVVVPYGWADGASPVKLHEGENTPFSFVSWNAMQSMVVSDDGATFKIMRVTVGANQEMEPTGDVTYWTCGPFDCMEGMDAPGISIENSPACQGWDPMLTLEVGRIDNDGIMQTNQADTVTNALEVDDGYDLGWVYSSSLDFTSVHDFGTYTSMKVDGADGSDKGLAMKTLAGVLSADADDGNGVAEGDQPRVACLPDTSYGTAASNTRDKPRNCFRLHVGDDYLSNYTVTLMPKGAGVDWGSNVDWETDPFEDISSCGDAMPQMAAEDFDVCELFAAEVEDMHADKLDDDAQFIETGVATKLSGFQLIIFKNTDTAKSQDQYTAMWYHDGTKSGDETGLGFSDPTDLYRDYASGDKAVPDADERGTVWVAGGWVDLVDDDGDPIYGDLGKVDIHEVDATKALALADRADNYLAADNPDANKCTAADGGTAVVYNDDDDETVKTTGSLCDAEGVEIETSVTYTDNFGDQECSVTVSYTLTCDWDASGETGVRRGVLAAVASDGLNGGTAEERFLSCTVAKN